VRARTAEKTDLRWKEPAQHKAKVLL
jgi:hypothetical protein